MKSPHLSLLLVCFLLAPAGGFGQAFRPREPLNPAKAQALATSPLTIQGGAKSHAFTVELANTVKQQDIGLMHRTELKADRGMLFNFQHEEVLHFWMRNTFIPLDMLFIRASGEVMAIFENTEPHSERGIGPNRPAQAVLELAGGTAARLGLKPGDVVKHPIFAGGASGK